MFDAPDWFKKYQMKDAWGNTTGANPMPAAALSTGLPNAAPQNTSALPGGAYNDMDNAPYNPATNPNNSSQAMRGAPVPPVQYLPASQPSNPPMPPRIPGGNYATTTELEGDPHGGNYNTTAALEGDTAGQPYWASASQKAAAGEDGRQIGPGSWFDPSKMGSMIDKNSVIGKLMAMHNAKPAPPGLSVSQPQDGLLSPLVRGIFG